jgi:CubicO group peptidase (beta-lactamase class C family)
MRDLGLPLPPARKWPAAKSTPASPACEALLADTATFGETFQLLVIRKGQIVFEGFGPGQSTDSTNLSWSMAKSWTHALVGVAILKGILPADLHLPVWEYWPRHPGWDKDRFRAGITMNHLLTMQPGLQWREEYANGGESDVIPMLNNEDDMGLFAAAFTAEAYPGTVVNYSSGTTNIIADILTTALCPHGDHAQRKVRNDESDCRHRY